MNLLQATADGVRGAARMHGHSVPGTFHYFMESSSNLVRYYYSHFTGEASEAQRSKDQKLMSGGVRIQAQG